MTEDEQRRRELVEAGHSVVANLKVDHGLIAWAEARGLLVYIGRRNRSRPASPWANPYKEGRDGDRPTVIEKYRRHLDRHPELVADVGELRGKVLGCWCYPLDCHGGVLLELLAEESAQAVE